MIRPPPRSTRTDTLFPDTALFRSGGDVFHAVRDASGLDLNGVIGVHRRLGGEYEIGYWFAARVRGKGIATEAVRAVIEALAASRPGRANVAECPPDTTRSRAFLRRVRSDERRVGKGWVSSCRSRGLPDHLK